MNTLSLKSMHDSRGVRTLALAAAVLFAMAAGALAQSPAPNNTDVTVTIGPIAQKPPGRYCYDTGKDYFICVDQDLTKTKGNQGDPVRITWTIKTSGWAWVKNKGIDIKPQAAWQTREVSPTVTVADNKKENGATLYKYDINVTNGTVPLSWDPFIMN